MAGISTAGESAGAGVVVGPPPPFDAELLPALAGMAQAEDAVFTLEMVPAIRQAPSASRCRRSRTCGGAGRSR